MSADGCRQYQTSNVRWYTLRIAVMILVSLAVGNILLAFNLYDGVVLSSEKKVVDHQQLNASRNSALLLSSASDVITTISDPQTRISTSLDHIHGVSQPSQPASTTSKRKTTTTSADTTSSSIMETSFNSSSSVQRIYGLFFSNTNITDGTSLYASLRLQYTSDPDEKGAWWVAESVDESLGDLVEHVNASLHRRINIIGEELKNHKSNNNNNNNRSSLISPGQVFALDDDDDWRIIIMDYSDMPSLNYLQFIMNNVAALVGKQRVYLVTRGTTTQRAMKNRFNVHGNYKRGMSGRALGQRVNITSFFGHVCAGVKRFHFPVRDDVLEALKEDLVAYGNEIGFSSVTDPVDIPRPKHAAHFWSAAVVRKSFLRSRVSLTLQQMQKSYKNLTFFADLVGFSGKAGRQGVHPAYVRALLEFKIIVVCQRDRYEDHYRLFEAMISGALVMSDPALEFPWGIVDGETIVVYRDLTDLQEKILYYLSHTDERLRIARTSRMLALNHHRVQHRYEDLLLGDWTTKDEYGASLLNP